MARPKSKEYVPFSIKMDKSINQRFRAYADKLGQTYTICLERILSEYLDEKGFTSPRTEEEDK